MNDITISRFVIHLQREFQGAKIFILPVRRNLENIDPRILTEAQRQAINHYRRAFDRNKRLIARSFLFAYYCNQGFQQENFEMAEGVWQRPYLKNCPLDFSFSYSGDYIVIALTCYSSIGVDAEYQRDNIDFEALSHSIMHPREQQHWQSLRNYQARKIFFYHAWASKEALIKALGCGLHYPLPKLNTLKSYFIINGQQYRVVEIPFLGDYQIRLAYRI